MASHSSDAAAVPTDSVLLAFRAVRNASQCLRVHLRSDCSSALIVYVHMQLLATQDTDGLQRLLMVSPSYHRSHVDCRSYC